MTRHCLLAMILLIIASPWSLRTFSCADLVCRVQAVFALVLGLSLLTCLEDPRLTLPRRDPSGWRPGPTRELRCISVHRSFTFRHPPLGIWEDPRSALPHRDPSGWRPGPTRGLLCTINDRAVIDGFFRLWGDPSLSSFRCCGSFTPPPWHTRDNNVCHFLRT